MIQGFYSAASALTAATQQQDLIAQNLAHGTVPGYRKRSLAFGAFEQALAGTTSSVQAPSRGGTQPSREYTSFQPGDYQQTGNSLELAVRGDGFFTLEGPEGPVYTRNGSFELSATGQLQSTSGLPVSGTGGPITIPTGTSQIDIAKDGTVSANGAEVGQIRLAAFQDQNLLVRVGPTLFEAPPEAAPQQAQAQVLQGYREGSNVAVVQEMVSLIVGSRHYEAATKALRALADALQQRTSPQATA